MRTEQANRIGREGFEIFIPLSDGVSTLTHILPRDIYQHKQYPVCKCGRKFVPINKGDKTCFFCNFTEPTPQKIVKMETEYNRCQFCGETVYNKIRVKRATCMSCVKKKQASYHKKH